MLEVPLGDSLDVRDFLRTVGSLFKSDGAVSGFQEILKLPALMDMFCWSVTVGVGQWK